MAESYLDKPGLSYFWGKIKSYLKYRNISPESSKTFTGLLATADNWEGRAYFFGSIKPTTWYDTWIIRYRIATKIPGKNTYAQTADVTISGVQGDMKYYASMNAISSYYPCSYHELYRLKSAGLTNGYGHALGFQIASGSSYHPTDAGYERTIIVDVYETINCTFEFFNSCLHYADIPGTGSTNYNTYSELNFTSNGLQETGDANDPNYQNRIYYLYRKPYTVLYRYQILLSRLDGTLLPINTVSNNTGTSKTLTTESFDPFGEIYFYNTTTTVQTTGYIGNATIYRQILADLRYSFNTGTTLIANKPVFLVAVPQSDGSAKLHTSPISQEYPSTEDGLIYILLGYPYAETSPYRLELYLTHPVYWYKNGRVRLYNPDVEKYLSVSVTDHVLNFALTSQSQNAILTGISAVYTQTINVFDTDSLDILKTDLVVTAIYDDSSTNVLSDNDYTLTGNLQVGTSTITVSYRGYTTTFNVTVIHSLYPFENGSFTFGSTGRSITVSNGYHFDYANTDAKTSGTGAFIRIAQVSENGSSTDSSNFGRTTQWFVIPSGATYQATLSNISLSCINSTTNFAVAFTDTSGNEPIHFGDKRDTTDVIINGTASSDMIISGVGLYAANTYRSVSANVSLVVNGVKWV